MRFALQETFSTYLGTSSVSCILVRLAFDYPVNKEVLDLMETWCRAMASKIISLRVFLCQVDDRVSLGWLKKERAEEGWKEMTEDETHKLVDSDGICPAVIEPCERCERCAWDVFVCASSNLHLFQFASSTAFMTVNSKYPISGASHYYVSNRPSPSSRPI